MTALAAIAFANLLVFPWVVFETGVPGRNRRVNVVIGGMVVLGVSLYVAEVLYVSTVRLPPEGIWLPRLIIDPYFVIFWGVMSGLARAAWLFRRKKPNR